MNISLKSLNRCDYYLVIWALYNVQGLLYPEGIVGQIFQGVLIVWAIIESKDYLLPNKNNPPLLKAISVLLFMYCVYGVPLLLFNPINHRMPHVYLQLFLCSFLPVFVFYKYLKDGILTPNKIRYYIWVFLLVAIWHYFKCHQEMIEKLRKRGSSLEEITNNAGYEFLALIPITFFFYKKPLFQYSILCLILLFIVMAMKRGPILIGVFCFVWVLYMNIKASENIRQRYATILLGFIIVVASACYITYQISNSDYMVQRIEETKKGNSSGRDHLYSKSIEALVDDNSISNLIIGRGAWATTPLLGKGAHQDWLETAINNGLLGICILLYFCITFLYSVMKKKESLPPQIHTAFQMSFFIFISKTMFSMSLADIPCFQSMLISFCIYYKEADSQFVLS